jgi:hypothetical protein
MTILPTNISLNITHIDEVSEFDSEGAIIYIIGVLIWYAIGFGLILIDDFNPQAGHHGAPTYASVYQTVTDLHEHQARNDILVELKDKERRLRLWQIYYGISKAHPLTIQKDNQAVELIVKQLDELNERQRSLRKTLNEISIDQTDETFNYDDSDSEIFHGFRTGSFSKSNI